MSILPPSTTPEELATRMAFLVSLVAPELPEDKHDALSTLVDAQPLFAQMAAAHMLCEIYGIAGHRVRDRQARKLARQYPKTSEDIAGIVVVLSSCLPDHLVPMLHELASMTPAFMCQQVTERIQAGRNPKLLAALIAYETEDAAA